jgi:hypothetical protein
MEKINHGLFETISHSLGDIEEAIKMFIIPNTSLASLMFTILSVAGAFVLWSFQRSVSYCRRVSGSFYLT